MVSVLFSHRKIELTPIFSFPNGRPPGRGLHVTQFRRIVAHLHVVAAHVFPELGPLRVRSAATREQQGAAQHAETQHGPDSVGRDWRGKGIRRPYSQGGPVTQQEFSERAYLCLCPGRVPPLPWPLKPRRRCAL